MPTRSTTTKPTNSKPAFKNEAEEADWYHTAAGRKHALNTLRKGVRNGKIVLTDRDTVEEATALAKHTGKVIIARKGLDAKPTDPAALQKLLDEARASMSVAVSLRLPVPDLDAAKALAKKRGIGYQTLLKSIIRKGLREAS